MTADPDAYSKAVTKGKALMAAMQAFPDSPSGLSQPSPWTSYDAFQKHGWSRNNSQEKNMYKARVSYELIEVMQEFNISEGSSDNTAVFWEHGKTTGSDTTYFEGTFATSEQLYNIPSEAVIAIDINSPADQIKTNKDGFGNQVLAFDYPVLQHWSDITFLQWQALAGSNPAAMQNLKCVMHSKVSNPNTKAVIRKVFEKRGKDETREVIPCVESWTRDDGDDFLALLGSPNGSGTGFMLAQHKKQLGWKVVTRISVYQTEMRVLVLEIGDLP